MLYRTQITNSVLPADWKGPVVYTVFIEAENVARAMSLALQRASMVWGCRLGDLHLVGRVVDEQQLRREFPPLDSELPADHVLLGLSPLGPDVDLSREWIPSYDETLLFVGREWHFRLSKALFWTCCHVLCLDAEDELERAWGFGSVWQGQPA